MKIITFIVKIIITTFLTVVTLFLFVLWLIFGTLLLIALLIRLVSLYTIALLNSFISATPLTQDYTIAIEDVINMYINIFSKILSMPQLPWIPLSNISNKGFRALLPTEMQEIKKSWAITLVVFVSYIFSLGISSSFFVNEAYKNKFESKINFLNDSINDLVMTHNKTMINIMTEKDKETRIIQDLRSDYRFRILSIAELFEISQDSVNQIINEQE
ncbi:unnamed protein product [marine sediment metagenome]|uniref:Uncharacterized protein n=1 Tax=marine sediment metagenome TaxID=412755 RepID=X0X234_9ZZZZ